MELINNIGRLVFLYLPLFSIAFGYFVARCAMNHVHYTTLALASHPLHIMEHVSSFCTQTFKK
jgi:hypothetical protein